MMLPPARDAGTPRDRRLVRDQSATSACCLVRRVPAAAAAVVALAREVDAAAAAVTLVRPPAAVALACAALRSLVRAPLSCALLSRAHFGRRSCVVALVRAVVLSLSFALLPPLPLQ